MKITMKSHGDLNQIGSYVCKITMQLLMASLVLVFISCEKEEIFEPVQEVHEVDESVKATARIVPELSLQIRLISKGAAYDELRDNRVVKFNGSFYSATSKIIAGGRIRNQIWSSLDGSNWSLRRTDPFPIGVSEMIAHDGKIFVLGTLGISGPLQVYSSSDGYSWSPAASSLPFSILSSSGAVVFNNKIFVFAWEDYSDSNQNVYSSPDGINWTLENANAFPVRLAGTPVVFKDALYYMGGLNNGSENQNTIFKSTNGRDWSLVPGVTPTILRPTENFPAKSHHAAVVHNNAVWVTGWGGTSSDEANGNDIWVSDDMENWTKYTGHVTFKSLTRATMLSYKNQILLLGGFYYVGSGGSARSVPSKYIWSIKPKSRAWIPVEIPRDRPTIPRF